MRSNTVLNLGAGRAVRNPSVLERYSDRFPAVKFQTAAEFLGNPNLVPEKSREFNAGLVSVPGWSVAEIDVLHRVIDDYITVTPDADLPKRLPLNPPSSSATHRAAKPGSSGSTSARRPRSDGGSTSRGIRAAMHPA